MDRYIFSFAAAAMIVLGVAFALWPASMVVLNRDAGGKSRLPTTGEVLRARILGLVLMAGGSYFLYALWTGMPGAEFFPA